LVFSNLECSYLHFLDLTIDLTCSQVVDIKILACVNFYAVGGRQKTLLH
jgi:hypothetical protein